ncbi:MAG: rhomboid family intramembrane serine protease [Planctomycetaceae bacterium]|nr:rhomboid family intramembrane serine protease [Planctomycetaceae bacterium]
MGIYNRDYLRDEGGDEAWRGNYGPPSRSSRPMVVKIIVATVIVYLVQILTLKPGERSLILDFMGLSQDTVLSGQFWRLLTYAFCHSDRDIWHILFNMMVLYMFGRVVEELMGRREFLWFYLTAAVFAGIASLGIEFVARKPVFIVGASGAVSAIFLLYVMHYPRQKLYFFGLFPLEARILLIGYVLFDAFPVYYELLGGRTNSHTAHSAHLGGFLFGFLYFRWNMRLTRWWDQFAGRLKQKARNRSQLKIHNPGTQPQVDHSARVDEILDKISRQGESSLTAAERRILTDASRQMRKDRE